MIEVALKEVCDRIKSNQIKSVVNCIANCYYYYYFLLWLWVLYCYQQRTSNQDWNSI